MTEKHQNLPREWVVHKRDCDWYQKQIFSAKNIWKIDCQSKG